VNEPARRDAGRSAPIEPEGVILLGQPNVGKSAMFAALTKSYVTISNYPGTTVEVTTGSALIGGERIPVMDTPGAYSFIPSSEDERVTRDILLDRPPRIALAVGDAKNLDRTLTLALQLSEMGQPYVLCLNMMDEAKSRGFTIDCDGLSAELGVAVIPTVAIAFQGISAVREALREQRTGTASVAYPEEIEQAVSKLEQLLPETHISKRALALMILAGDDTLVPWLKERVGTQALSEIEEIRQKLRRCFQASIHYLINQARLRRAHEIAQGVSASATGKPGNARSLTVWFERMTVHPVWSVPVLAGVLYLSYLFVGVLGADMLVGFLEDRVFGEWINPTVIGLADRLIPWQFLRDLLVGQYGILTMALTYALALILPIVGTFFITFGLLEDSGYLPRLAIILNRIFKRMGLNGKAVLPMVLGLGCDTMATLTTRILETRKERLIVIILLSLAVPCSAQLTVIMAMLGSVSLLAVVIWVAIILLVMAIVGSLAAVILPGQSSDFIVELPPLRMPRMKNILVKMFARIEWYLKEAVPLFLLGTLVLFTADKLNVLERIRIFFEPVVTGWLGLPRETAEAFLIGFLRRDFGAAGLYQLTQQGRLDAVQVVVASVTITLFIPCIAHFFMTAKERGWATATAIAAFVFPSALLVGGVLNWALRAFPIL
jgi:ferrous iron transport protein B